MVTRKSGDDSRDADVGNDRPGSYVKVSGSRRRRKRRGITTPPRASSPQEQPRIVDTVGEDEGRVSEPDFPRELPPEHAVDDLRRGSQPSSNRPRREIGPLGLEDVRTDPVKAVGSDRPRGLQVIEINASEEPTGDPFGDEITTESDASQLFAEQYEEEEAAQPFGGQSFAEAAFAERDRELARQYELDAPRLSEEPRELRASQRPSRRDMLVRQEDYDTQDARHSLSSVLGARPSLRPSPQPEKPSDSSSLMWWVVVAALAAIIAAAGAIAARENFGGEQASAPVAPAPEPGQAPAVEPSRPRVSFGTPQTGQSVVAPEPPPRVVAPAPVAPAPLVAAPQPVVTSLAKPVDPKPRTPVRPAHRSTVPPAQSAAVRPGAPYTSAATGAVSSTRPNATGPAASAVKPTERKARSTTKPGEPAAPKLDTSTRGKPNLTPATESRGEELEGLPVNPYR